MEWLACYRTERRRLRLCRAPHLPEAVEQLHVALGDQPDVRLVEIRQLLGGRFDLAKRVRQELNVRFGRKAYPSVLRPFFSESPAQLV